MPGMTSLVERLEQELYAAATARPRDSARYAAVLERAVQTCGADPEAAEVLDLADLYFELATEYETLGRCEDALAAADAAVDAGPPTRNQRRVRQRRRRPRQPGDTEPGRRHDPVDAVPIHHLSLPAFICRRVPIVAQDR
jgi:hypothetical protein